MKLSKADESRNEIVILDECIANQVIAELATQKWDVATFTINDLGFTKKKNGELKKALDDYFEGFDIHFFTGDTEKGKKEKDFTPSESRSIIRLSSKIMQSCNLEKIEYFKKFFNKVKSSHGLLGKELTITPDGVKKKFENGHTKLIRYTS